MRSLRKNYSYQEIITFSTTRSSTMCARKNLQVSSRFTVSQCVIFVYSSERGITSIFLYFFASLNPWVHSLIHWNVLLLGYCCSWRYREKSKGLKTWIINRSLGNRQNLQRGKRKKQMGYARGSTKAIQIIVFFL